MKTILNKLTLLSFVAIFAFAFTACNDVAGPDNLNETITSSEIDRDANLFFGGGPMPEPDPGFGGDAVCTTSGSSILKASNNSYNAGTVEYVIEDDNLIVTYIAADGVGINETHLWVGVDLDDMPSAGRGQPRNGHFPYGGDYNGASIAEYIIPLSDISGYSETSDLYIVAHAVVQGSSTAEFSKRETAYAGDEKGNSPRWWWYIQWNQEEECEEVDSGGEGSTGME